MSLELIFSEFKEKKQLFGISCLRQWDTSAIFLNNRKKLSLFLTHIEEPRFGMFRFR